MSYNTTLFLLLVLVLVLLFVVGALATKLHLLRERLATMHSLRSEALAQLVQLTAEMNKRGKA